MDESIPDAEGGPARSTWTLRLAGPQDDCNEALWAANARSTGYGLGDLLEMASRRRLLIAAVFVAAFVPAAAWVWTIEPAYEVSANVVVKPAHGAAAEPLTAGEMVAEIGRVRSRMALRQAVETHGLAGGLPGSGDEERIGQAVQRLSDNLRVGSTPESGIITIQYANQNAKVAAGVVNTLANLYVDAHRSLRAARESVRSGDDTQLAVREMALQKAQQELDVFERNNERDLLGYSQGAGRARSAQLADELRSLDGRIRSGEKELDELRRRQPGAPAANLAGEIAGKQSQLDETLNLRAEKVKQLEAAESWRSRMDRMTALRADLRRAVEDAQEGYVQYQGLERVANESEAMGGRIMSVTLGRLAAPPSAPVGGASLPLLLLSALAAACLALAAAALYDPRQKPAAYVADIAAAGGAPVLMMIEETQSHVS